MYLNTKYPLKYNGINRLTHGKLRSSLKSLLYEWPSIRFKDLLHALLVVFMYKTLLEFSYIVERDCAVRDIKVVDGSIM